MIKNQLQEIISCLPLGVKYNKIRLHLNLALNEIKNIETQKPKKQNNEMVNRSTVINKMLTTSQFPQPYKFDQHRLNQINKMIEIEQKNLDNINTNDQPNDVLLD